MSGLVISEISLVNSGEEMLWPTSPANFPQTQEQNGVCPKGSDVKAEPQMWKKGECSWHCEGLEKERSWPLAEGNPAGLEHMG